VRHYNSHLVSFCHAHFYFINILLPYINKGSHKWSLFSAPGPWQSQDGVTVDLYNISPALWGQSGSNIGRIGVIVHELGHYMGAPDMYDTDGGKLLIICLLSL
jgi:hypothetical protein